MCNVMEECQDDAPNSQHSLFSLTDYMHGFTLNIPPAFSMPPIFFEETVQDIPEAEECGVEQECDREPKHKECEVALSEKDLLLVDVL